MNKELKTLKENFDKYIVEGRNGFFIREKKLKAEAVKRAKYFNFKLENLGQVIVKGEYWKGRLDEVIEANNLTEEDLKC